MIKFSTLVLTAFLCLTAHFAMANPTYTPWTEERTETGTIPNPSEKPALQTQQERKPEDKKIEPPPSALENLYAKRVIDAPKQFGYDLFDTKTPLASKKSNYPPMGAVQDDFILSSGDELLITFMGQRSDRDYYTIDSRGNLLISDLPPITAMGKSISQIREELNAHLKAMPNTSAYISLSSVKQVNILVVGHVKSPGRKALNVFHTVLDALSLAGGIEKNGSLRSIKLVRDGRSTHIDLYALLMHGAPHIDIKLRDGDRIIIPPIGPTVAITGAVKRPGIYEIKKTVHGIYSHTKDNSEHLSLNQMLDFAGGVLSAGDNRFMKLQTISGGQESVENVSDFMRKTFSDGTILSVVRGSDKQSGKVELIGHTRSPGIYDLDTHKTLSQLLENQSILGDDIYPLIGLIERWDEKQLTTRIISYPIRSVFNDEFDMSLMDNDTIILLSNEDIMALYDEKSPSALPQDNEEQGSRLNDIKITDRDDIKTHLKQRSVFIRGAVQTPGRYPVADGTTLENILAVAGGMTLEANRHSIEITSSNLRAQDNRDIKVGTHRTTIDLQKIPAQNIALSPGDSVRINQKYKKTEEKTVLIVGEVLRPGEYDLLPGDKVSSLIERAGGLTGQAYPDGAIFSRESERKTEKLRYKAAAHDMEQRLAAAIERDKNPPTSTQIEMVRTLSDRLSRIETVGRITVEVDPDILSTKPELDMYLEKGDRLYIPKRPLTVRVSGEVLSPANLQFRDEKDPLDYIQEAGGFSYHADKNRTFVLYPDGSAQPLRVNHWNHTPTFIPPGSTVVVPRDPKPFDFIESAKEIGQIMSNLAITSVFIDDIRD